MPISEWVGNVYNSLETQWYALVDWLQSAGIPARTHYADPLDSRGLRSFPTTIAIIILLLLALFFLFGQAPSGPFKVTVLAGGNAVDGAEVQAYLKGELVDAEFTAGGEAVFKDLPAETITFNVSYKDYPPAEKKVDLKKARSATISLLREGETPAGGPGATVRPGGAGATPKPRRLCGGFWETCCDGDDACTGRYQCGLLGKCMFPTVCGPKEQECIDRQVCCVNGTCGIGCQSVPCPPCNETQYCNATDPSHPACWPITNLSTLGKLGGFCRPGDDPCNAGLQCKDGVCVKAPQCGSKKQLCEDFDQCCGDGNCRWVCEEACVPPCGPNQYCDASPMRQDACKGCDPACLTCSADCVSQTCKDQLSATLTSQFTPFMGGNEMGAGGPSGPGGPFGAGEGGIPNETEELFGYGGIAPPVEMSPECQNCSMSCLSCNEQCLECAPLCRDCDRGHCECGDENETCCPYGIECKGELQCYDGKCRQPKFTKNVTIYWDGKNLYSNVKEITLQVDPIFPVDAVPIAFNASATTECPNPIFLFKYMQAPGSENAIQCFNQDLTTAGALMFAGDGYYQGCPYYSAGNTFPPVEAQLVITISCVSQQELNLPIHVISCNSGACSQALVVSHDTLYGSNSAMLFYLLNQNQIATKQINATPE